MPKKIDDLVAISIMRDANFEPLEPYTLIKTPWKCRCLICGNISHPILNNVKSGQRGCRTCGSREAGKKTSLRKRMSQETLDKILREKHVSLLDDFQSTKEDLKFQCLICQSQFITQVRYLQQVRQYGCPECRKPLRKVPNSKPQKVVFDNVVEVVSKLGFSTNVSESRNEDVIEISCLNCQNKFKKKFVTLKQFGFICPCKKIPSQIQRGMEHLELARAYASSRGGEVLSENILHKKDQVLWKCSKGHVWEQPLSPVLGNESWCKDCAGQTPRTLAELQEVAKSRGGKVLSSEYVNVDAIYEFECSLGHKFSNSFKHVVGRGQWCPRCNKGSKSEEICRTVFEQLFEREFIKVRPSWLRNSRGRQMEIDGFNEELKIGFEYQGIQHFGKQFYGTSLEQRILDDQLKAKLCSENGVFLFIIDYLMEYEDFPKEIRNQALTFGLDVSGVDFNKSLDISKAYIRDDRLPILKELLKEKQITVLSEKWIGVKDKYKFRCELCGHEWEATGSHFFNSRRVGGCKKCAMRKLAGSNRLNLAEMQDYAKIHGGECVSTSYGEIKQKYQFRCRNGHEFEDIFNNMKFRKTFCPTCEGRTRKKFLSNEEATNLFLSHNLKPKGPRPKLLSKGWEATCLVCGETVNPSIQHLIQRSSPCRYCSGFEISERRVRDVFAAANLEPLVPFKSSSTPWKARCTICQSVVNGRYTNLVKGQGGCRTCASNRRKNT